MLEPSPVAPILRPFAWRVVLALALMAGGIGPSRAAEPSLPAFVQARTPIVVRVVRSANTGCAPDRCPEWIALDGPIGPGSAASFEHTLRKLGRRRLPILINSPGGLVSEAMTIGRAIRAAHLDVAVSRTVPASCPADRDACRILTPDGIVTGFPESRRAFCASACPLVLAGGTRRFVSPWAHVGVHQYIGFVRKMKVMRTFRILTRMVGGVRVEVSRTLVSERPLPDTAVLVREQAHYDGTAAYFARMGIGSGIMPLLRSAPASGIDWLTPEDLASTRMATDTAGGEDLIAPAVAQSQPTAADRSADPPSREIAALIDDAGTRVTALPGHVAWSVDQAPDAAPELVAKVALDDDAGTLEFRVERHDAARGPGAVRVFARLLRGRSSPFQHILAVETPGLRKDVHALSDPLLGRPDTTPPAVFSMVSTTADDVGRDMALLSSDAWVDVPVMIDAARTIRITFALGPSGTRAVRQWAGSHGMRAAL